MRNRFLLTAFLIVTTCGATAQWIVSPAASAPTAKPGAATSASQPVARVNGTALTERDLLREMYAIFPYARQHGGGFPKGMEPEIRKGAMQMLIFEELVYQEALRRHMSIPATRITGARREFRKRFASDAEYTAVLRREFQGSEDQLGKEIQRSMLIEALLKSEVDNKAVVSIAEARAFYDRNPDKFQVPEAFEFQSISVMPPQNPDPAQQKEASKRAQSFLRQAQTTKSFQEFGLLAEKISEDDFRVNMGDHGAVPRATLPPQIVQAALAMKPGQVSGLIQIEQAYTIFRLNKHIPAGKQAFAEVRDQLRAELQKNKVDQLRAQLGKRLRTTAKVETFGAQEQRAVR